MIKNAARQPKCWPMTVLNGTPSTVASEPPTIMMASPLALSAGGVTRTTMGLAIDQNTA